MRRKLQRPRTPPPCSPWPHIPSCRPTRSCRLTAMQKQAHRLQKREDNRRGRPGHLHTYLRLRMLRKFVQQYYLGAIKCCTHPTEVLKAPTLPSQIRSIWSCLLQLVVDGGNRSTRSPAPHSM